MKRGFLVTVFVLIASVCFAQEIPSNEEISELTQKADEKVTVFCKEMALREVMRQLSRPFGYTWVRSGAPPGPPNAGGEARTRTVRQGRGARTGTGHRAPPQT